MNSENSCDKKIVRVSSKKWERNNVGGENSTENNDRKSVGGKENVEDEEEIVDPYTKKRRESLKTYAYDIAGKVSKCCLCSLFKQASICNAIYIKTLKQ